MGVNKNLRNRRQEQSYDTEEKKGKAISKGNLETENCSSSPVQDTVPVSTPEAPVD